VGRRWQRWGEIDGALVIDDYAHHPTEVAATLEAARNTGRHVRAVLQPHRWVRTARHWAALADAAALADEVLVLDVYAAGEAPIPGVSPQMIADRIGAGGGKAQQCSAEHATRYLSETLASNDLVITLGAGDVWRVAAALVERSRHGAD
jgi:UDP-N-acetylmuramate--alanine ligase